MKERADKARSFCIAKISGAVYKGKATPDLMQHRAIIVRELWVLH